MRSLGSRIPPLVLQLIAKEADREVACGPTAAEDILISDIKAAAAAAASGDKISTLGPRDLVYEVARQLTNGTIIYLKEHMERFAQSNIEVFEVDKQTADTVMKSAHAAVSRLQSAHHEGGPEAPFSEQNIKYIAWEDTARAGVSEEIGGALSEDTIKTIAFYIKSNYPPKEWYVDEDGEGSRGASMGLLFGPKRTNPHAKVVYPELKEKAARLVSDLGVFESLIVHEDGLVPEGTRSNYILVTRDGSILSSSDEDILVGTTLLAVRNECKELGVPVISRKLGVRDIIEAEALAMLGTSVNVLPINTIVLSADDAGHKAISELSSSFSRRDDRSLILTKKSRSNAILRRLNDQYKACTFK